MRGSSPKSNNRKSRKFPRLCKLFCEFSTSQYRPTWKHEIQFGYDEEIETWRSDILARFPDWQTGEALARWPVNKARLNVGQQVTGIVIACAPFGMWIDISFGHPALLLVTETATELRWAYVPQLRSSDYHECGRTLAATIVALGERAEIVLSQFPKDSFWFHRRPA